MIDRGYIGHVFAPRSAAIEFGQLRFFANAIGEDDSEQPGGIEAGETGQPATSVPPTFLFCLEMGTRIPLDALELLGIDIARILHGEQSFAYRAPVVAGDTVTFQSKITDIYDKKGGALEFFVLTSAVRNQHNTLVAELCQIIAVRN